MILKKNKNSVAISPEGTRSIAGQLIDFKKGPFHLALDCKIPIVPIVIYGAFELLPPKQLIPGNGNVYIHFSKPIPYQEYKDMDYNQMLVAMRKHMLKLLEENFPSSDRRKDSNLRFYILHFLSIPITYSLFYIIYYSCVTWILSKLF